MHELKRIRPGSIERALGKAERYRLLNEPRSAESICRDILDADRDNADALKTLVLAITDQFTLAGERAGLVERRAEVEGLIERLPDAFARHYYRGVLHERWAKGLLATRADTGAVHDFLIRAMESYEAAEKASDPDNQDAELRWNTCVRLIARYGLAGRPDDRASPRDQFDDEVPHR